VLALSVAIRDIVISPPAVFSDSRMTIEKCYGSWPQHHVHDIASVRPDGAFAAPKDRDP
jgi:hypothetical protein